MDIELKTPKEIPVLPLRDTVVFPGMTVPITIGKPASIKLVDDVSIGDKFCCLVLQKKKLDEDPQPENLYRVGTLARIVKMFKLPTNTVYLLAQGIERIEIKNFTQKEPYIKAHVNNIQEESSGKTPEIEARMRNLLHQFKKAVSLSPKIPEEESYITAINIKEPGRLADFIIANLSLSPKEQQDILETLDPIERLNKVAKFLNNELEVLMLQSKIQEETKSKLGKAQREYFLRQQLESIRKELGEGDENAIEIKELRKKIEEVGMSQEAMKEAKRELNRLDKLPPQAAEYHVIRTYLDWLVSVPWNKSTKDNLDINQAAKVLDEDHHDLEKVKDRILEFLAVMNLKKDAKGPVLCFAGPPGVGKTSLGQSIARALGRKFVRLSLGGIRDEAEIRGHRRTYIGALPGRIIQGLRRAGTNNPVFMLDEVDKIGTDFRGDPSSALLEVLDPEQNNSFSDHYLDVSFDLSKVMFITTANILDTIPHALRDRMEVLELPGYPQEEKLIISKKFLLPRQIKENGLKPENVKITDPAIRKIIREYTREAGVRNVEREIANILRKVAKKFVKGKKDSFEINEKNIALYLGPIKFFSETAERTSEPGVATGLAWTPQGGEILFIEANKMSGKKDLTLTGQLGQTMQESAKAALSYVRSKAKKLKIDEGFFEKYDIHIHVPQGAVPKDGPSAGVAIATALVSLLTNRLVKYNVAMTGEITLKGKILPVGGIKEKVLAASRAGIKEIILPARNKKDLEEIPAHVKKSLKFTFVKTLDEVFAHALKK
ncbi:MAG: endopeptidase La [Candidatus Omnitrophica bacterium]|nr:endopeptidase La [Candidatus Omnitrophota bacterium]MBU1766670.1 endopeptidase La [Candidatus Omnitrophota bacterium]MBU1889756.1 endopeptidase La [Candidatus Omnitrophota bacterium]